MDLAGLRTYFRILVDDRNSDRFSDTEALNLLNRAQEEVQKVIVDSDEEYFSACQSYNVVADTDSFEFTLPADTMKICLAERLASGAAPTPCEWVPFATRHVDSASLGRVKLYLRGLKVGVVAPTSAFTVRMWYVKRLPDLAGDTDTSEIPVEFHPFICLTAARICYLADGRNFDRWEAEYQTQRQALSVFIDNRERQEPRHVRYTDCY